jgi:hypothetical protein
LEIVGIGGSQLQIKAGVVGESEGTRREADLPLKYTCGRRCPPDEFDDMRRHVTCSGQPGPRIALVVRDAGQRREAGPGSGQVGGALPIVH